MQVILLEEGRKARRRWATKSRVKDGFARNFLLQRGEGPARHARRTGNMFQAQKAQLEARNLDGQGEAEDRQGSSTARSLRADPPGRRPWPALWFGVAHATSPDVDEGAASRSIAIRSISSVAIKAIGLFTISVVLHPEVKVNITINVARSEDEAERQARGEDVLAGKTEAEEARVAAEEIFEEGARLPTKPRKKKPRKPKLLLPTIRKAPGSDARAFSLGSAFLGEP